MKRSSPRAAALFTALALLLAPMLLLVCGFALPPQYDDSFVGALGAKCARLRQAEGPRLVLVGGSSVAFGVDCALLEQELPGYTAVNFGLYAALGTEVMLELALPDIRPGDVVILSPEQQTQTLSCYFNAEQTWQALDGSFALLARLGRHRGALAGQFPAFAGAKLRYFARGQKPQAEGVYRRASFNEYGDVAALCAANRMPGQWDAALPVQLYPAAYEEEFIACMNAFAAACASKGATVYYRFCPMNAAALAPGSDPDACYDWLAGRLTFPILGDPADSVLAPGWFYDTNFHTNTAGKQLNTRRLVRALKAAWGDASPTRIPVPAMPLPQDTGAAFVGDNRDADYFIYEATEAAAAIIGVTEAGRQQTVLTLPTHWQGLPVSAIRDGALAGCAALRTLRLQSPDPAACVPGNDLLAGLPGLRLAVPAGCGDAYRLSYFWAGYAARMDEE